jgi:hypothetical protein
MILKGTYITHSRENSAEIFILQVAGRGGLKFSEEKDLKTRKN